MADRERRAPVPWAPFAELESLARWPFHHPGRESPLLDDLWGPGRGFAPAVDVSETEDRYTLTAELPGTKREDVRIEIHEGTLTLRGEKRSTREQKSEHRRHVERSFGAFSRSFSLPPSADTEHIDARFEDGVLTIEIPKLRGAAPRSVEIRG